MSNLNTRVFSSPDVRTSACEKASTPVSDLGEAKLFEKPLELSTHCDPESEEAPNQSTRLVSRLEDSSEIHTKRLCAVRDLVLSPVLVVWQAARWARRCCESTIIASVDLLSELVPLFKTIPFLNMRVFRGIHSPYVLINDDKKQLTRNRLDTTLQVLDDIKKASPQISNEFRLFEDIANRARKSLEGAPPLSDGPANAVGFEYEISLYAALSYADDSAKDLLQFEVSSQSGQSDWAGKVINWLNTHKFLCSTKVPIDHPCYRDMAPAWDDMLTFVETKDLLEQYSGANITKMIEAVHDGKSWKPTWLMPSSWKRHYRFIQDTATFVANSEIRDVEEVTAAIDHVKQLYEARISKKKVLAVSPI